MKILHYSLGFPPYRTGGLTKFCMDLMITQQEHGHEVGLLWPGQMGFIFKKTHIRESMNKKFRIASYEIVNPLPVPLDEGIKDIEAFTVVGDVEFYKKWLMKIKPDIIHIHTLMGLHKEVVLAAKACNIRTVFTTHDYFGLCPRVTLFKNENVCNEVGCESCITCNSSALGLNKIKVLQHPLYRCLKDTTIVKKLRQIHRNNFFEYTQTGESIQRCIKDSNEKMADSSDDYIRLRNYYIDMTRSIDVVHYNSSVAEQVYRRYFQPETSKLISITHRGIQNNQRTKNFSEDKLRITYLGPAKAFKGFKLLKAALDEMWNTGCNKFELHIFSKTNEISPYMSIKDGYRYNELENIFERTDVLVAPSIWYETFGFTVLEALSYGVPVIVSESVGAKDIIEGAGEIINNLSKDELINTIVKLSPQYLREMNVYATSYLKLKTMSELQSELERLYRGDLI